MSVKQLQLWHIPATPINYAVSYEFVSGSNKALISAIKEQLQLQHILDSFFIEDCYKQYILGKNHFREEMINDMGSLLNTIQTGAHKSAKSTNGFIQHLDKNLQHIRSTDRIESALAAKNIYQASHTFKTQQQKLVEQLMVSQQKTQTLKRELEEVKKEIYLDPLTGLYNRKAMGKHIETWVSDDPNKRVAAIVINIDKFTQIKERFGPLISDVLLSKVANKVSSYVGDSGLPVRCSHDEFLILLPEVQRPTAREIAEKIRQGVEKLRFISSKSGIRLPKMTISLGVNDFKVSENVNQVVSQTRNFIDEINKRATYNQVAMLP